MEEVTELPRGHPPEEPESDADIHESEIVGPETLDEAVEGLSHQEEWVNIYITRPLRGRTTQYVLQAAKEIPLTVEANGSSCSNYPTQIVLASSSRRRSRSGRQTPSLGIRKLLEGDPAGNSSAENGIKWAKARVRALLSAARAPPKDWPLAIQHASADLWAKAFPDSSWTMPSATAFGNEVWFRAKLYKGKCERKHEASGTRWKKGWYRGPAMDVKRGHVIARDDGGLTVAKSVKFGIMDLEGELKDLLSPAVAEGLPEEMVVETRPRTRMELREEAEFRARKYLEDEIFEVDKAVELYRLLELLGDTDKRLGKKSTVSSWYTGAYVHGGVAGVRSNTKEFPYVTKYLTRMGQALLWE